MARKCLVAVPLISGLVGSLAPVRRAPADDLTLFVVPPSVTIRWSSPREFVATVLLGQLAPDAPWREKHKIGHAWIRLRRDSPRTEVFTGMTTVDDEEEMVLLRRFEYGLGIIGTDLSGRLEEADEILPQLEDRCRLGTVAFIRFILRPETTNRLLRYLREYRARGCDRHYGGANRPLYGEGAGCSAFAVSFLEVAGILDPAFEKAWKIDFRIPIALYGGLLHGKRVPLVGAVEDSLLNGRWASPDEPHVSARFWDPGRMFAWIREHSERAADEEGMRSRIRRAVPLKRAPGLVVDCAAVPTPVEPIWRDPAACPNPYGRQPSVARRRPPLLHRIEGP